MTVLTAKRVAEALRAGGRPGRMFTMSDIIARLKDYDACPDDDIDAAVAEITRLRSLVRFQDGVIRSGDVACLTEAEREALEVACEDLRHVEEVATLRGLLERMPCATAGRERP